MLIASLSQIRYGPFLAALGPVALFGLALDALVLVVMFRADLRPGPLEAAGPAPRPMHRVMTIKGLFVTAFVLDGVSPRQGPGDRRRQSRQPRSSSPGASTRRRFIVRSIGTCSSSSSVSLS